jgi:hypothetical protein
MTRFLGKTITADAATSEALNRPDFDHNTTPMMVFDSSTLAFSAGDDAKKMASFCMILRGTERRK